MKRYFKIGLALTIISAAVMLISSCDDYFYPCIYGNGIVDQETRSLPLFTSVNLTTDFTTYIIQDTAYWVEVEAEENLIPYVLTGILGGNLIIKTRDNYCLRETYPIKVFVHTPDLNKIVISGSGNIFSDSLNVRDMKTVISGSGDIKIEKLIADNTEANVSGSGYTNFDYLETDYFESVISGSGMIKAKGYAETTDLLISGSGDYRLVDLMQDYCKVRISGSGSAWVNVSQLLDVTISGSGSVYYKGSPAIDMNISGSGKIIRL
ncbi:MAG TPA: head GIN domain-containing protein [Bacteroidia bacterium]|nr:DUF2807 domain-containing protein [Sphingobacteriales bacterium]HPD65086.1 head GIN domain-containing protein [Bacteroidia bacterium]HRS58753.1 head GIN domain-containing protein [Bacteroidia bacterium]HRU67913.1 head GIN domain-containing protein [Bacteroidia bacterium]